MGTGTPLQASPAPAHSSAVVPAVFAPPSRTVAVKDGHFGRPRGHVLDGREHGGNLDRPGMLPARFSHDHRLPWSSQHQTARSCSTLLPLPPYSPELNPAERIWLYLEERFLSHNLLADAACNAWNCLAAEVGRIASLSSYPWIPKVGT